MRAIVTKYLGPTDRLGARVVVTDPGWGNGTNERARRVFVDWDDGLGEEDNHAAAARVALQRWERDGLWVGGSLKTENCFVCVTSHGALEVLFGPMPIVTLKRVVETVEGE